MLDSREAVFDNIIKQGLRKIKFNYKKQNSSTAGASVLTYKLSIVKSLGQGSFGKVYKVMVKDWNNDNFSQLKHDVTKGAVK